MANELSQNPFAIDTAGATSVVNTRVRIAKIRWVSPSAVAGHRCVISRADATKTPIFDSYANGANFVDESYFGDEAIFPDGLQVTTLGSGVVYIYYR